MSAPQQKESAILFSVANQPFLISASAVQEIRSTDSLGGSAVELPETNLLKVRHVLERNHRVYFVVNTGLHFGLPSSRPLLVLILREHRVAALVDRIDRMTEITRVHPLPASFVGDERRWYRGLAYLDSRIVPVIEPRGFLTNVEIAYVDKLAAGSRVLQHKMQEASA